MPKLWVLTLTDADTILATELHMEQGALAPSGRSLRVAVNVTLDGVPQRAGLNDLLFTARQELLKLSPGFKQCGENPLGATRFIESWSLPATPATED